ncbi:hypothetical protein N0V90_003476 [Kalmusia sp. IMI 367209]|nr:hypothetical protein N0V90_003476 [Kalmusia sp. IMI 367209]
MSLLGSAGYQPNNANPKAALSPANVKGKVPEHVFAKYQRAENAQNNNYEQMPIFAAAILASLIAERSSFKGAGAALNGEDATGLTTFIAAWFAVRTAYNVAYISISSHSASFTRSALWAAGTVLASYQIFKAAKVLG